MTVTWAEFVFFAVAAVLLWFSGALAAWKNGFRTALWLVSAGLVVYAAFIVLFWTGLHRPPMRTLGETRLWYSFFMIVSGLLVYARWKYRWILFFSSVLATVFVAMNLLMPEIHDRTLMPALQSAWFVPHVTVYMFSYSVIGCAAILAVAGLAGKTGKYLQTADTLMYTGMAFLTLGMLSGALWAKGAWGMYWSWDPKETWAAVTWLSGLAYIHLRLMSRGSRTVAYLLLLLVFAGLQMCWYGVDLLPSAQESMHVYGR